LSIEEDRLSEFPEIHPDECSVLDSAIFDKAPVENLKLGFDPQQVVQNDAEDVNILMLRETSQVKMRRLWKFLECASVRCWI